MDENKDTQRTESISKFLDVQNVRVNPFGDNRAADRAYRRAERIVAAIHLLTNHIDALEPIRNSIRAESVSLLKQILDVRDEMRSAQSRPVIRVLSSIRHLISLARMLAISGFASIQNTGAITDSLDELGNFLTASQRTSFSESVAVSRDELLDVGSLSARPASVYVKDTKDRVLDRTSDGVMDRIATSVTGVSTNGHVSVRTQSVLEILKTSGSMGIKDICLNLPEYSEKMIQRELLGLVAEGRVTKVGLKRWSRYSITQ